MVFKIGEEGEGEETTEKFPTNTKHLQEAGKNVSKDMLIPSIQHQTAPSGFM